MNDGFIAGFETHRLVIKKSDADDINAKKVYKALKLWRRKKYNRNTPSFKRIANKRCVPLGCCIDKFHFYRIECKTNNETIGLLALHSEWPDADTLFIGMLFLIEKYQENGYGTEMISTLLDQAKRNYTNIMIRVHKTNKYAPKFFTKHGFTVSKQLSRGDQVLIRII